MTAVLADCGDEQLAFLLEVVQRLNGVAGEAAARIAADSRG